MDCLHDYLLISDWMLSLILMFICAGTKILKEKEINFANDIRMSGGECSAYYTISILYNMCMNNI